MGLLVLLAALVATPFTGETPNSKTQDYLAELTVEVTLGSSPSPLCFPVHRGQDLRSNLIVLRDPESTRYVVLYLAGTWIGKDMIELHVRGKSGLSAEDLPKGPEMFDQTDCQDLGWYRLVLDRPVGISLNQGRPTIQMALRRNVPDKPAVLDFRDMGVTSIEVTQFWETRDRFVVELANRSSEGVWGLAIGSQSGYVSHQAGRESLIQPGQSEVFSIRRNPESTFFVGAVVFEDGTFEGDPEIGGTLLGQRWGQAIQLRLALSLWETAISRYRENPEADFGWLNDALAALPSELDPFPRGLVFERYPRFNPEVLKGLPRAQAVRGIRNFELGLSAGLSSIRVGLNTQLGEFQEDPQPDLTVWLTLQIKDHRGKLAHMADVTLILNSPR